MLVNSVNVLSQNQALVPVKNNKKYGWCDNSIQDSFVKSTNNVAEQISAISGKNYIKVISFGNLDTILTDVAAKAKEAVPAIQMRVSGVRNLQDNMLPEKIIYHNTFSINKLADSKWKDGDPLAFFIGRNAEGEQIYLLSPEFGTIGRVPDKIASKIVSLIKKDRNNYKFELSNVVAGNSPAVPTIGLRVNLKYTGKNPVEAQEAFNSVLNDSEAARKAFFYQEPKNSEEVLEQLFNNIRTQYKDKGDEIVAQMQKTILTIVKSIEKNDSILLVGHCKPDGDCLGSIKGLENFIKMLYPDKILDCAVADEIPALFKQFPVFENVKHPYSQEHVSVLEEKLAEAINSNSDKATIKYIQESLKLAKDPNLLLDANKKYDAVILMDIPSPARFTSAFKQWIRDAKDVIYVDHHPLELQKWESAKESTGVDMQKIIKNNLAWVADQVAAAAQQSVVIASKLLPDKNPLNSNNIIRTLNLPVANTNLDEAVKAWSVGLWTDTSSFSRGANLAASDIKDVHGELIPVEKQPNYFPEGLSKWLFSLTNHRVDKKWLRDNLKLIMGYRDKMLEYQISHRYFNPSIGFGYTTSSFDEIKDVLEHAILEDSSINRSTVVDQMKLSEVMNDLRISRKEHGQPLNAKLRAIKDPESIYDYDRIAVFISESERKGELNTEGVISQNNALRFSFRSYDGTEYAAILASLFNGGGHPSAAGGHLVGEDITLSSKFKVKIDGQIEKNPKEIYNALKENYLIKKSDNLSIEDIEEYCSKIELVEDEEGKTPAQIIESMVSQIRKSEG